MLDGILVDLYNYGSLRQLIMDYICDRYSIGRLGAYIIIAKWNKKKAANNWYE